MCRLSTKTKKRGRTQSFNIAAISHGDVHRPTLVHSKVLHHTYTHTYFKLFHQLVISVLMLHYSTPATNAAGQPDIVVLLILFNNAHWPSHTVVRTGHAMSLLPSAQSTDRLSKQYSNQQQVVSHRLQSYTLQTSLKAAPTCKY